MPLTSIDRLLWALALAAHLVLLAVILSRRRAAAFPIFTSLITLNVVRSLVLYFTLRFGSKDAYFYTYWCLAFLDMTLQIVIVYELATHVFRPLGVWAPDVRRSSSLLVGLSLFVGAVLTALLTPVTPTLRQAIMLRGEFFSSALLSELFVAMIALSVNMGLPWKTHVARLAQGFGIYSLFGVLLDTAHTLFASGRTNSIFNLLSHVQMALYLACVTFWIVALTLKEPAPRRLPESLHAELRLLQRRAAMTLQSVRTLGSAS